MTKPYTYIYRRGTKPSSIKNAQREVREFYQTLCTNLKGLPRGVGVAKSELINLIGKEVVETSLTYAPTMMHSIDSAVEAYVKMGSSLMSVTMYSMDLHVPVSALHLYPGVQEPKVKTDTVIFQAKELP